MGTSARTDWLKLVFQNVAWSGVAAALGSPGNVYISLHTADPSAGTQSTNEAAYTNYARVIVPRTTAGWTVASNAVVNAATVVFPTCGVVGGTYTHFAVGTGTEVLFAARLTEADGVTPAHAVVSTNLRPKFDPGALVIVAT